MRVEIAVELGSKGRGQRAKEQRGHNHQQSSNRARQLRWLALALHIDYLIRSGEVADLAAVARMCGVSRARVSKVVGMLGMKIPEQREVICK